MYVCRTCHLCYKKLKHPHTCSSRAETCPFRSMRVPFSHNSIISHMTLDKEWSIHEVFRSPIWSALCSISTAQRVQRKCSHIPVSYSLLLVDGQFILRRAPTCGCWKVLLAWRGKSKVIFNLLTEIEDIQFNHLHGKSSGNSSYPSKVWQNSVFKNKNREGHYSRSSSSSSNNM